MIHNEGYDQRVDVWGLGCIAYQLTALTPPFAGDSLATLFHNIVHKSPAEIPW